jgi:hypothetical protein
MAGPAAPSSQGGEIAAAVVVLDVFARTLPHYVPEAAPPRFALLENGQVFVGGTRDLASGRLSGGERKELERKLAEVRRLPGLSGRITLGSGDRRRRLRLLKGGRPLDLSIEGDPKDAVAALRPLPEPAAVRARRLRAERPRRDASRRLPALDAEPAVDRERVRAGERAGFGRGRLAHGRHSRFGVRRGPDVRRHVPSFVARRTTLGRSGSRLCAGPSREVARPRAHPLPRPGPRSVAGLRWATAGWHPD